MTPETISPRIILCNGQFYQLHTKFRLSKCNFLARNGLHEYDVMSQKCIPSELFYVCIAFEGRGKCTRVVYWALRKSM